MKSVGGVDRQSMLRGSTVNTEAINTVDLGGGGQIDDQHGEDQQSTFTLREKAIASVDPKGGRSTIDTERIKSTFTSHEKVIASVDPGGVLTVNVERINSQLSLSHEKVITSVDPGGGGGGLTVNLERINSECREGQQSMCSVERVNSQCREVQQSM